MGIFTKDIRTFDDLFLHQLQDVYYAETRIAKALPDMVSKARSPELRQALEAHLGETRTHVANLEQAFARLGVRAEAVTCQAIDGIVAEAEEVAGEVADPAVLDAALIAAAQAVEHYEIACYGTLVAWGTRLGHADVVALLERNLADERRADALLTTLAERDVNEAARRTAAA